MGFLRIKLLKQSLITATVITICTNMLSRVFGFIREAVIASYFGTSSILDLFILAVTIPELITVVILAALPTALLPSLNRIKLDGGKDESTFFWSGLFIFIMFFLFVSFLMFKFSGEILLLLAPNISNNQLIVGKRLISILSFFILFRGLEAYFRSWMFEKKHFIVPVSSNIIFNIVIISSIFLLYDKLDIVSLAYGWLIGSALIFIYNGFFAFKIVRPSFKVCIDNQWVKRLMRAMLIIIVIESIFIVYPVIDRYLASKYLGPGQISALRYATVLIQLPTGIIIVAINIALFPWISDFSIQNEVDKISKLYTDSIRMIIFVMGFIAAGILIFSNDIVQIAFQRGDFNRTSLQLTSSPLMCYALGIIFNSIYIFQMRFYYAKQIFLRLGIIRFVMLAVKLFFSISLIGKMEQDGLALATSIAWFSGFIAMTVDLGREMNISIKKLFPTVVGKNILIIFIVALFWIIFAKIWIASEEILLSIIRLIVIGSTGTLIYLILAEIFSIPEPRKLINSILLKLEGFRG